MCKLVVVTIEQKVFLSKQFGGVRFIYNYLLSRNNKVYEKEKRTIHINDLKKEIPLLKVDKSCKWRGCIDLGISTFVTTSNGEKILYKKKLVCITQRRKCLNTEVKLL